MYSKYLTLLFALFVALPLAFSANTYNAGGDFSVYVSSQKDIVSNDNINSQFTFNVKNLKSYSQTFKIEINNKPGWDINVEPKYFTLNAKEQKTITINFSANSEFDYTPDVVSPDIVKLSQRNDYVGHFEFPVTVKGMGENISLKYELSIERPIVPDMSFSPKLATSQLSPILPLRYTITANNLKHTVNAFVRVELNNEILAEFTDTFTSENNYKIYEKQLSKDFEPGTYEARVTVRVAGDDGMSAQEWYDIANLDVIPYNDVSAIESFDRGFFKDTYTIKVINNGNVKDEYVKDIPVGFFESMLFGTNIKDFYRSEDGVKYKIELNKGEKKDIVYSFNYVALYVLLLVILILLVYMYHRKTSNPLDVETKIYEVQRVEHEGVKGLKVRIGFENIKEHELDDLRVVFRMPSYLQIKDGSFLLTEPRHVLKGKEQFKLIWDFKHFEQNESRIIGFQMVNHKGVLGDIRLPDVEFEVKKDGKTRTYYARFPIIRG